MKAALWLRVSSSDQTTENQRIALERFAQVRGFDVQVVYDVEGSAYRGDHRAALAAAHEDARQGRFEVFVMWALDRLERGGIVPTLTAIKAFEDVGVRVISMQEAWSEAPAEYRELLHSILGWVSEMESKRRGERVRAGQARARAQGTHIGRPKGSKDQRRRRKSGYFAREEAKR